MKRMLLVLTCLTATPAFLGAAGTDELAILSFPIGLVTGEIPVDVDLGPSQEPAMLYLDGTAVCTMTAALPRCSVDLGPELHVHLLELVRRDAAGRRSARAERWVNRPGLEAEARVLLAPRTDDGVCGGRLLFAHPTKQPPATFQVEEDGRGLRLGGDGRSFRFPCPDPAEPHLITASAVFPDGARAEAVTLVGGFGGATDAGLRAVALASEAAGGAGCEPVAVALGSGAIPAGDTGFEVVFVLDPRAGYNTLYSSRRGHDYWHRAFSTLHSAAALWYVIPDAKLSRVNGFQVGRETWLRALFATGMQKFNGRPRIADAVAASGLVAAAGPRRRAVVLFLAGRSGPDASTYTPAEAQAYLAEVGVPLVVLRNGKRHDDGWPEGVPVFQMAALVTALEEIQAFLDRQCIVWLPNQLAARDVAAALPPGVVIAGRDAVVPGASAEVWRRAEAVAQDGVAAADEVATAGDSIDVTATAVLVRALDGGGRGVDDLSAAELTVTEDGDPTTVLALEPVVQPTPRPTPAAVAAAPVAQPARASDAGAELPVVVYVDTRLGGKAATSAALAKLQRRADWLTSLGPVELVLAGTELVTPLTGSRDPEAVSDAFAAAAATAAGRHQIDLLRGRFVREIRRPPKRAGTFSAVTGSGLSTTLVAARSALAEEDARIAETLSRLREWAATVGVGPRLLLLVGTSFDEDPLEFYLPLIRQLEPMNEHRAREELRRPERSDAVVSLGRELAAAGWTVVPMAASSVPAGASATAAEVSGSGAFQSFLSASLDANFAVEEGWLQVNPLTAQRHLAGPSGGTVAYGDAGLDELEAGSRGWYRLSYQVGRPPDGVAHSLVVECARPAVELLTTTLVTAGTSEDRSTDRLRRLLAGEAEAGGLGVVLAVGEAPVDAGGRDRRIEVTATVDLGSVSGLTVPGADRTLRFSVAVTTDAAQSFVSHRTSPVASTIKSWRIGFPLVYPAGPARLAVVFEDLASGAWGGAVGELPP